MGLMVPYKAYFIRRGLRIGGVAFYAVKTVITVYVVLPSLKQ